MKSSICAIALCAVSGLAVAGGGTPTVGPDVQVCRLWNLDQKARDGQLNGFSIATTSRNEGDTNLDWYASPSENHPFISYNLFRMSNERCEQIGVSWIKHGFFATNQDECPVFNTCVGGGGSELKPDCGDTYGSGLNASLTYLGPRYEVDPWSGAWEYDGSLFDNGVGNGLESVVDRLMVIHDDDLDPSMNPGMTYYAEGYYVAYDDVKHMNSASYRPVGNPSFNPTPGGSQNFWTMSSPQMSPTIGFAFEEWGGNESLITADGTVPVEGVSADGRCILSCKVFDNGDGTWNYEYLVYNVDMDVQMGKFEVPIPAGVNVTNVGFHAPTQYEEMNATPGGRGTAIDNTPWAAVEAGGKLTWSTTTNPLRWGTAYNFRFTADSGPTTGTIDTDAFRVSSGVYETQNFVPMPVMTTTCDTDFDMDGDVDLGDFGIFGAAFGSMSGDANYNPAADFDNDGDVDLGDFGVFGTDFNRTDC